MLADEPRTGLCLGGPKNGVLFAYPGSSFRVALPAPINRVTEWYEYDDPSAVLIVKMATYQFEKFQIGPANDKVRRYGIWVSDELAHLSHDERAALAIMLLIDTDRDIVRRARLQT